jgi:hypothetical protein
MNNTKQRFGQIIGQLSVNYRRDLSEADVANVRLMLAKWGIDELERAIHAHMFDAADGRFYPSIANIAKYIDGTESRLVQDVNARAAMAWHTILAEIKRVGSYGSLKLEDKQALAALKAVGGWVSVCGMTEEQLAWKGKEFIKTYEQYERVSPELLPHRLPGRVELSEAKLLESQGLKGLTDGLAEYKKRKGVA